MKHTLNLAAALALLLGAIQSHGQSAVIDFQDNTDDGFGLKFSNDASQNFAITNINGSLMMAVPRTGAFQEADRGSVTGDSVFTALNAAANNPSGYVLSYDWYVNTAFSPGNYGNFLQIGTYFNAGGGSYAQDFPGSGKDVELNGTQLSSGQVFSGTVSRTFATDFGASETGFQGQTFLRFGFIMNGDGSAATVYFDNISITPVPEPSTLALLALGAPAAWMLRRRIATRR